MPHWLENLPWEVTSWNHRVHPDEIKAGYKGNVDYQRPVIVDCQGLPVAEFLVGHGFEAADAIARKIVWLVNAQGKTKAKKKGKK